MRIAAVIPAYRAADTLDRVVRALLTPSGEGTLRPDSLVIVASDQSSARAAESSIGQLLVERRIRRPVSGTSPRDSSPPSTAPRDSASPDTPPSDLGIADEARSPGHTIPRVQEADSISELPVVRIHHSADRLSAGAARNLGVSLSPPSDFLFFLDSDCTVKSKSLFILSQAMNHFSPVAVSAEIVAAGPFPAWLRHLLEFKDFSPGASSRPGMIPSTAMLCRRPAFVATGGFPDMWPGEDLVLSARWHLDGHALNVVEGAIASHEHPPGLGRALRHQYGLGQTAAMARRMVEMPGSALLDSLWCIPLLFAGRALRGARWAMGRGAAETLRFTAWLPLYLVGLAIWTAGFARGRQGALPDWPVDALSPGRVPGELPPEGAAG